MSASLDEFRPLSKMSCLARKPTLVQTPRERPSPLWSMDNGGFLYQFLVVFFEKCLTSEEEDQTVGLDMGQRFKEGLCVHTGFPSSLRECNRNPRPELCLLNSLGTVSKLEFPTQVDKCGSSS